MKYIDRTIDLLLSEWRETAKRKPILLRGARQVGKTSSVRHLSEAFEEYIEVNFELDIDVCRVFETVRDPQEICRQISLLKNGVIEPGRTLLFLDEIQACPAAIEALRFFYEKMPELHVIAAGSLLEFALRDLPSFGVGRIRSIFMYPLTFNEFLHALGEDILASAINEASKEKPLPEAVHKKTLGLLSVFMAIGGMPESAATYCETKRITACHAVLDDILVSLYGDFSKYHTRMDVSRIRSVFASVIRQTGGKFVFAHASEGANSAQVRIFRRRQICGSAEVYAGSALLSGGTSGGRVLGVTATAPTLKQALADAYAAADTIDFDVELVEGFLAGIFVIKDLDHLLTGDHFLDIAVYRTQGFLLADEVLAGLFCQGGGDKHHRKDGDHGDEGHNPGGRDHGDQDHHQSVC